MSTKLFSIVGRSGSGKTTLITKLIPCFVNLGLKIGSIKHTHHEVILDKPGKDSWKHGAAGSSQVLLITGDNMAVFGKTERESTIRELCDRWFTGFDLVISEGFKNESCFKIEVTRKENNKPPLFLDPSYHIEGIVADYPVQTDLPTFGSDEVETLFNWLCEKLNLRP